MARSTVAVKFTGDTSSLKRALGDLEGKVKSSSSRLGGIGKSAALGIAGGAAAVGIAAKSAVDAGSDLNETLSKSNTVFGDQAKRIESWAGSASKNFGQSKQQALEAASSFGNMFTQLGIGEGQAADMSTQMTELASDFASFHNADISEVLTAQQAAFRGEYDALQRFVPTINAAAVEQEALAQTGKKTTKELTAQEKALAVQTLMMKGAGDAQGDFARTSDGLANKQRIMSAQFADVQAKVGQALIPVVLKLADVFLTRVVPAIQQVAGFVQQHWPQIQATIQGAVQGVAAVVTPIVGALQTLWQNFGNNILSFMQRVWPAIQLVISSALEIIRGVIQTVTSLIKGDWSGVWEGIKGIVSGVWGAIQGIVRSALEGLRLVIGAALEVVGSMFKGAWEGIINFFKGVPGKLAAAAGGMFDFLWDAFKSAVNRIIRAWNNLEFTLPSKKVFGVKVGGQTLGTPNIPELATGGIVKATPGGVLARIGEGRYDEAVIPLNRRTMGGGNVYNITLNVPPSADAAAVGKATVEAIKAYERRSGAAWRAS